MTSPLGHANSENGDETYFLLKLLQIDLAAQAVGMVAYADLLSPHVWFIVAIVLILQQVVLGQGVTLRATSFSPSRVSPRYVHTGVPSERC